MAGHSKWANIKHRKGAVDAKKSSLTQKITQKIRQAALTNSDPKTNVILKSLLAEAREANIPKNIIERALKKESSSDKSAFLFEFRFANEIEIMLKMRGKNFTSVSDDLKRRFKKIKLKFLPLNSISFLFERKFYFLLPKLSEEQIFSMLESPIEQFIELEEKTEVFLTDGEKAKNFQNWCSKNNIEILEQREIFVPTTPISVKKETLKEYTILKKEIKQIPDFISIFDNVE